MPCHAQLSGLFAVGALSFPAAAAAGGAPFSFKRDLHQAGNGLVDNAMVSYSCIVCSVTRYKHIIRKHIHMLDILHGAYK